MRRGICGFAGGLKRGFRRDAVNELQEWEFRRRRGVAVPQGLRDAMAQELGRQTEVRVDDENLSDDEREGKGTQVIGEKSVGERDRELQASAARSNAQPVNKKPEHAKRRHANESRHRSLQKCTKCFSCRILQRLISVQHVLVIAEIASQPALGRAYNLSSLLAVLPPARLFPQQNRSGRATESAE